MFAEYRWSLHKIKHWAGWSDSESSGTVVRYLLEEVWDYENSWSDTMSPCRNDLRAISFMGDHCTGQFQVQINAISQEITHVKLALKEFSTSVMRCLSDIQRRFDSIPSSSRHESFTSYDSELASNAPTARLCESVTTKIPPANNLDDVVKQWYRGDP